MSVVKSCLISLGGNLGNVAETFRSAVELLHGSPRVRVLLVSSTFRTPAVGGNAGGDFLNAAAEIETDLDPEPLLDVLQEAERGLGRKREVYWGPRTLDLDLLFYGAEEICTPRLVVPHPAAWYRRFVLDPLVEIAPQFVHPVKQVTIAELQSRLMVRDPRIALAGGTQQSRSAMLDRLRSEQPRIVFEEWNETSRVPNDVPLTFIIWLGPGDGAESESIEFNDLPLLPRVDATESCETPIDFIRYLIQSACL